MYYYYYYYYYADGCFGVEHSSGRQEYLCQSIGAARNGARSVGVHTGRHLCTGRLEDWPIGVDQIVVFANILDTPSNRGFRALSDCRGVGHCALHRLGRRRGAIELPHIYKTFTINCVFHMIDLAISRRRQHLFGANAIERFPSVRMPRALRVLCAAERRLVKVAHATQCARVWHATVFGRPTGRDCVRDQRRSGQDRSADRAVGASVQGGRRIVFVARREFEAWRQNRCRMPE